MKIQPMSRALPTQIEHPRATYFGPDWTSSLLRPGCQQHLQCPSRRGDALVFHRGHDVTPFPSDSKA
jgi:hypothetical protein